MESYNAGVLANGIVTAALSEAASAEADRVVETQGDAEKPGAGADDQQGPEEGGTPGGADEHSAESAAGPGGTVRAAEPEATREHAATNALAAPATEREEPDDFEAALRRHKETAAAMAQLVPEQLIPCPPPGKPAAGVAPRSLVEANAPVGAPDPVEDLFKKADLNDDGSLDCGDVARLLIRLRALATESSEDEDWLVPSEQEVNAAMWGMDADRSGAVSIDEFREWFVRQGGLEYASNPALWGPDEHARQPEHAYRRTAAVLTPARNATDEQLASYYRQLDLDNENKLDATEVGKLLAKLRASGTACGEGEEWLAPSAHEVRSAMKAMDADGDGTVSQAEFSDWFSKQGGWDYASSPALWADSGGSEEEGAEEEQPIVQATPRRKLKTAWKQTEDGDVDASVAALFRSHDSTGDGVLDRAEVCELLCALRQRAISGESGATEEDWMRPTDGEVSAAMTAMDGDGDGYVTLSEFSRWWKHKGGWEYAEDPGMWGVMSDEDDSDPAETAAAEPPLPGAIPADNPNALSTARAPSGCPSHVGPNATDGNAHSVQAKTEADSQHSMEEAAAATAEAESETQKLVELMIESEDAAEQSKIFSRLGAIAYFHGQVAWALRAEAIPNIIGVMLVHQLEETVQYEGCALLYGLCAHRKQEQDKSQGASNSTDDSVDIYETMLESARHEGAVGVLKAARLRFPQNADIQIYSCVLLSALALKRPQGEPAMGANDRDLEEAAMAHARRMVSLEEELKYVQARVRPHRPASTDDNEVKQKSDEDRPVTMVQQLLTAEEASQVSER